MSKAYESAKAISSNLAKLRFLPGGDDYDALVGFPFKSLFKIF